MRYVKTVDLWDPAINEALRQGTLKLQSGQWVQCGDGPKSRFDEANLFHIRAFHGGSSREATQKYQWFRNRVKRIAAERRPA